MDDRESRLGCHDHSCALRIVQCDPFRGDLSIPIQLVYVMVKLEMTEKEASDREMGLLRCFEVFSENASQFLPMIGAHFL